MKGNHLVKTPGEFYSPTPQGVVVSADGVKDYLRGMKQEDLNTQIINNSSQALEIAQRTANSAASIDNIVTTLREHGDSDLASVLNLEQRTEDNEDAVQALQGQIGNLNLRCVSEEEYEQMQENETLDSNTIYFTAEQEV